MIQVKLNFSKKVKKYFKAQCTLFHSSNYDIAKHILSKLLLKEKPMKKKRNFAPSITQRDQMAYFSIKRAYFPKTFLSCKVSNSTSKISYNI